MLNERKLTKDELKKREDIIMDMKKNKRGLTKRYGGDAEAVMYGRATKLAKQKTESMNPDKIREMIKDALTKEEKQLNERYGMSLEDAKAEAKRIAKEERVVQHVEETEEGSGEYRVSDWYDSDLTVATYDHNGYLSEEKSYQNPKSKLKESNHLGGTGLIVIGRTQIDNNEISDMLDDTDYYGEWNVREGYWFFPEGEETLDSLEMELSREFYNRGINARFEGQFNESVKEDLDLGHQDDEPGMLKADLYRIGKYAMELYQMMDSLEGKGEVDFPHWWQSKIVKAKDMIIGAKHYLDFELKEPQIDAMVNVAAEEDVIGEVVGGKPSQEEVDKFFEETFQETHYLDSKPVEEWDEYDMSNWKTKLKKKEQGRPQFSEHLTTRIMKTLKESKYKKK